MVQTRDPGVALQMAGNRVIGSVRFTCGGEESIYHRNCLNHCFISSSYPAACAPCSIISSLPRRSLPYRAFCCVLDVGRPIIAGADLQGEMSRRGIVWVHRRHVCDAEAAGRTTSGRVPCSLSQTQDGIDCLRPTNCA